MDQTRWGPPLWRFLHALACTYTVGQHDDYETVYNALAILLPCSKCRTNYMVHLLRRPFPCRGTGRQRVRNWLVAVHNEVNRSLGKPVLRREEAYERIAAFRVSRELPLVLAIFQVHADGNRVGASIGRPVYRRVHQMLLASLRRILGRQVVGAHQLHTTNAGQWLQGTLVLPLERARRYYVPPPAQSAKKKQKKPS